MSVALVDHVGPWTIADVEALADAGDHSRYELLTPGVLTVSPAPGVAHQRVSRRLANLLDEAAVSAGLDIEVLEAVSMTAPAGRLVVSDIAVVDRAVAATNPTHCPAGSAHAVVEIVSPGSEPQDRVIKPALYAEAGIAVYWRFELNPAPHIVVAELQRGQYIETFTATAGEKAAISVPYTVRLDPGRLVQP